MKRMAALLTLAFLGTCITAGCSQDPSPSAEQTPTVAGATPGGTVIATPTQDEAAPWPTDLADATDTPGTDSWVSSYRALVGDTDSSDADVIDIGKQACAQMDAEGVEASYRDGASSLEQYAPSAEDAHHMAALLLWRAAANLCSEHEAEAKALITEAP